MKNAFTKRAWLTVALAAVLALLCVLTAFAEVGGAVPTEDASLIFYQATKDQDGSFSVRVAAGVNSLNYRNCGFDIVLTTKDESGNTVKTTLSSRGTEVYSSVFGGEVEYSVKETTGFEYAYFATVKGLVTASDYIELEVRPYVASWSGKKTRGADGVLLYTGDVDDGGYPIFAFAEIEEVELPFTPVLRFVVSSDVHITPSTGTPASFLKAAMEQIVEYVADPARNDGYAGLDAFAMVGDIANSGTTEEFGIAKTFFDSIIPASTTQIMAMGNHDWNTLGDQSDEEFEKFFGPAMIDTVVGGYHFITVVNDATRGYGNPGWEYSAETVAKLETMLAAAYADTGADKPIFVFQHVGNVDTVVGTGSDGATSDSMTSAALLALESRYPNLVVFSGHTHFPINDECSIHQKDFTSIGTGALSGAMPSAENGVDIALASNSSAKSVYVVELDENSTMRIRIWRADDNGFIGEEWWLEGYTKADFTYTEDRFSEDELFFAEGAEITTDYLFSTKIMASFLPVPEESLTARVYEVLLTDENGSTVSRQVLPLEYYIDAFDTPLQVAFDGLTPETNYTLSVYGLNPLYSADIASEGTLRTQNPLILEFTTPAAEVNNGGADIIDITVNAEKQKFEVSGPNNILPQTVGSPSFSYDSTIGMDVVTFDGTINNLVKFPFADYAADIQDSFTFETYICIDEVPTGSAIAIGASENSGGFYLQPEKNGKLYFGMYDSTGTKVLLSQVYTADKYYHVVATFDGSIYTLYIDGVKIGEKMVSGGFKLPNSANQWVYMGADVWSSGTAHLPAKCTIAKFALYSYAIDTDKVADLYSKLTSK